MKQIEGFESVQAVHGRSGGMLPGGTYAMVITNAKEDVTGYGNPSLVIAYDIAEGEFAGRYADVAVDHDQDWRHQVEIDVEEARGARLKALVEAVQASNPGYVWDWNEQGLVGKYVGIVLQERKQTNTRGKRKGQTSTYLDFWDAVPYQDVVSGAVNVVPPVNDKRTRKDEADDAPVPVPQAYRPQPQPPMAPQIQPGVAAPQAAPQQQPMVPQPPVAQYQPQQAYQPTYQQPLPQVPQGYQPQQPALYDEDVPF